MSSSDHKNGTIFTWLESVRARPEMCLREGVELADLETMVHGYYAGLSVHGLIEDVPQLTSHFRTWLYCKTRWSTSCGWAYAIREHAQGKHPLEVFFKYCDEYRRLVPQTLLTARLSAANAPTGKRVVIGMKGRMERPTQVQIVRYAPTLLHFLRFSYGRRRENSHILMRGTGSHKTSVAFAKRWVADELQTRDSDWKRADYPTNSQLP